MQMASLLDSLTAADIRHEPFPHLVARDLLPADLVARLIDGFPPIEVVTEGKPLGNNRRYSYPARKLLEDPRVSDDWKELAGGHLTQGFLDRFLDLFGPAIRDLYPQLAERHGPDLALRSGVRQRDLFRDADVLLEAQACVNTPPITTSTVRGPHVDLPDKLFAGLFYLRHPDDDSRGGDLQLCRYRQGNKVLRGRSIDAADIEVVDTVRYESNVLVLFLNGIEAVHSVTPREPTQHPRLFLNLVGEVSQPLFDLNCYQNESSILRRVIRACDMERKRVLRYVHHLLG